MKKAAEMIFLRYKTRLLNFCLRMLGNRADAEDVTAEAFLALFARKYTFNPAAKFSTWLYTVARNQCISQIRKGRTWFRYGFRPKEAGIMRRWKPKIPGIAGRELEKKEAAASVRRALAQLPYEQREVIVLREYHQLSYEEISQVVSCSLENVKILIFRGRERLKNRVVVPHQGGPAMIEHMKIQELVSADYDGQASAEEKRMIAEHLQGCPDCRKYAEDFQGFPPRYAFGRTKAFPLIWSERSGGVFRRPRQRRVSK